MLDRLKCAVTLAEAGNFHRAAQLLGMSQPHLTRTIKSLEGDLGVVLFQRGPHGATVTSDGALVMREASLLLKAEAVFAKRMEAIRSKASTELRIAAGAFISQSWASAAITALNASHPEIAISMRELDWWKLAEAAQSDEFDMAIGETSEAERDPLIAVEPFPEREGSIVVRAGHQLAGRNLVTLEEIAAFPLAGPRLPARLAEVLPKASRLGHISDDGRFFMPVIECATPRSMIDVVAASNAVSMIWREHCAEQLKTGAVVELPFHPPWLRVRQGIMYRRNHPLSPAALLFRTSAKAAERAYFSHRRV
jgi:DNA-binding transcriptional LysR family regulator